ncbi:MAG: DUF1570 domain-containing protein [Planctomycetaceae bacterium]
MKTSPQRESVAASASLEGRPLHRVWLRRLLHAAVASVLFSPLACRMPDKPVALPARHSVESEQLVVLSDFKLPKDHELIKNLNQLRDEVATELNLPLKQNRVIVYLFSDEHTYREYLNTVFPGLPNRRAYFVGTSHDLAVYTYWGDRIQEDLRHEYTHGLLHGSMKHVPLWLDEGLAEYFEVDNREPGHVNAEYVRRLDDMRSKGWKPQIERLEQIERFGDMRLADYQESWAWVHFMLHSTPEARKDLLSYIDDLRAGRAPTLLSARLKRHSPDLEARFLSHLESLQPARVRLGSR